VGRTAQAATPFDYSANIGMALQKEAAACLYIGNDRFTANQQLRVSVGCQPITGAMLAFPSDQPGTAGHDPLFVEGDSRYFAEGRARLCDRQFRSAISADEKWHYGGFRRRWPPGDLSDLHQLGRGSSDDLEGGGLERKAPVARL